MTNEFSLKDGDEAEINSWLRSTTLPQGEVTRAKIILSLAECLSPTEIARAQRVSCKTVHKWTNRYIEKGLDGLFDKPRSGRPTVIDDRIVKKVLKLTTERVPRESTHWSIQLMAEYAGITTWQVRRYGRQRI